MAEDPAAPLRDRCDAAPRRYRLDPQLDPSGVELLRSPLDAAGWTPTTGGDWDLLWCGRVPARSVFSRLRAGQLVNHFAGIAPLAFKDELAAAVAAAGRTFHPPTFSMPTDHEALLQAMAGDPSALWLRKPKRRMGGEGMAILAAGMPIPQGEPWVVQRYVANPLLLPDHPFKHVVRSYVVLTSLDPLTAFVHRNGPVKFTSRPYSLRPEALGDPIVHFTNPPIQRLNTDVADPVRGIDHDAYRRWLGEVGIDAAALFSRIDVMLAQTLEAVHGPVLALSREWSPRPECSFELLGFDVLIDDALNPWLLECNVPPSLGLRGRAGSSHRAAQQRAKGRMIADVLRLVGLIDGAHRFEPLVVARPR